jgi:peptidoglycan lytic transglycosylase
VKGGRLLALAAAAAWLIAHGGPPLYARDNASPDPPLPTATAHPPVPSDIEKVWLAPTARPTPEMQSLARAARLIEDGRFADAAPLLRKATLSDTLLADYQQYYSGLVAFRLGRLDEARQSLSALVARNPSGYLAEGARRLAGEVAEAQNDFEAATAFYAPLTAMTTVAPDEAWTGLGRVRQAAGDTAGASDAYAHVYYELPLSDLATSASSQIDALNGWPPLEAGSARYSRELGRAERLFGARRYAQARDGFAALAPLAQGDDQELIALRVAECDYYLKRYTAARDALAPWASKARRRAEARFFHLSATRGIGDTVEYLRLARSLVNDYPSDSWAEETLNNLGTRYIIADEDDQADAVFRELLQKFPQGRHAQRAQWKVGWSAYRTGRWADCARSFERAAVEFPRSDYRPSWLYWAARSREQIGDTSAADRLYGVLVADYINSYYGRLATRRLTARHVEPMEMAAAVDVGRGDPVAAVNRAESADFPTAGLIRQLVTAGLYADALNELFWVQRTVGDSPAVQATLGYVYSKQGDLRKGINAVKRAFPQYLSAAGGDLPPEVLQVLFPVAYWDLISRYGGARQLDPYLLAALIAQESTFDAGVTSQAHAIGLMQIVPSTGRGYARRLRLRHYSTRKLTDPLVNMQIGTAYFADLVDRFGGVPFALASYNAGPAAVARWVAERPGIAVDEFIDDIPYPETQNYVRKILGTAEDYRSLYGEGGVAPLAGAPGSAPLPVAQAPAAGKGTRQGAHKATSSRKVSSRKPRH